MKKIEDENYPGLRIAQNVDTVISLLVQHFPGFDEECRIEQCEIKDIQYQPGLRCILLYELQIIGRVNGESKSVKVSAQLFQRNELPCIPDSSFDNKYKVYCHYYETLIVTPYIYIDRYRLLFFVFPVDPALPTLIDIINPQILKKQLNQLWRDKEKVLEVYIEPIEYTPQSRIALKIEACTMNHDSGTQTTHKMIGKLNARKDSAKLFADAQALALSSKGKVGLAAPLGYLSSLDLTLQEFVDGVRLTDLTTTSGFIEKIRLTASAIAEFHLIRAPLNAFRPLPVEIRFVDRQIKILKSICPDRLEALETIRKRLIHGLESLLTIIGPVHGDLHSANVLIDQDRVTLIDLDLVSYGDTASDIGRFLSSMRSRSLRQYGDQSKLTHARTAFLDVYLNITGEDEKRIRLFEAAYLLQSAKYLFEIQWPEWRREVAVLIEDSLQILSSFVFENNHSLPTVQERYPATFDERKCWIENTQYIQSLMTRCVKVHYDVEFKLDRVLSEPLSEDMYRFTFKLSGVGEDKLWSNSVAGYMWKSSRKISIKNSLLQNVELLNNHSKILIQPRVLDYLSPLSLLMMESVEGLPFTKINHKAGFIKTSVLVARALYELHTAPLKISKKFTIENWIKRCEKPLNLLKLKDLKNYGLLDLSKELQKKLYSVPEKFKPSIKILELSHIIVHEQRITFIDIINGLVLSNPLQSVGDFLSGLAIYSVKINTTPSENPISIEFSKIYCELSGEKLEIVKLFEAMSVLREAMIAEIENPDRVRTKKLICYAKDCLNFNASQPKSGQYSSCC